MKKKKTFKERLQTLTYMQTSLIIFGVSFLLLAFCLWQAIASNGTSGMLIAITGLLIFFLSCTGIGVTLYGHLVVKIEGKINWVAGLITNGMIAAITLILYLSGLGG